MDGMDGRSRMEEEKHVILLAPKPKQRYFGGEGDKDGLGSWAPI